jgi:DNA (cytosine-5)-methyltransferase 1
MATASARQTIFNQLRPLLDGAGADVKARGLRKNEMVAASLGRTSAMSVRQCFVRDEEPASGPIDVLDLFSGCGGLSLGFEFIGRAVRSFRLLGGADINKYAIASYAKNLPGVAACENLSEVAQSQRHLRAFATRMGVRRDRPLVLVGGPPCQGFSAHQKKNGKRTDERNNLIGVFEAIAGFLEPDFVVLENVPELLSEKNWTHFEQIKKRLADIGYFVRAQIHNLAGFGVPQERFRALIMASKSPFQMPQPFLDRSEYRTVRQTISQLSAAKPGTSCKSDPMHYCTNHRKTTVDVIRAVPKDGGRRPAGIGPSCLDRVDGFRDVYGRMYWDRPANTITASARNPASGRFAHPEQDRGLTIREAALLQGFPQDFLFEGPFDDKFLQIGNAVPPVFSTYIAAHVLGELLKNRGRNNNVVELPVDVICPTSNSFSSGISGRKKWVAR